jgi:hypothetical protein
VSDHEQTRFGLRILGFILISIGIPLAIIGVVFFFELMTNSSSLSFDESAALGAKVFGFLASGMLLIAFGSTVLRFGYLGKVSKYIADETGPAISSVSKSVFKGVKEAGGVDLNVQSNQKVMIKCRSCGTLNDEDAIYCDKCGAQL